MTRFIAAILLALGIFLGGAWVSWRATTNHYQGVLAQAAEDVATEREAVQAQARERLEQAQRLGDQLSTRLTTTEATLAQKNQELSHALARFTTGRPCLDGRAVRLLNQPAFDGPGAGPVPQASSAPVAADAAAASDTDVAGWIAQAQHQYDTCRSRLDALIDFEERGAP